MSLGLGHRYPSMARWLPALLCSLGRTWTPAARGLGSEGARSVARRSSFKSPDVTFARVNHPVKLTFECHFSSAKRGASCHTGSSGRKWV